MELKYGEFLELRIYGPRVLVQMDEDKETVGCGILVKPQTAHEHVLCTGEVIKVGEGAFSTANGEPIPMSLNVGDGVLFIRFLANTKTGEAIRHHLGDDRLLLKEADVLLVYNRKENPKFSQ